MPFLPLRPPGRSLVAEHTSAPGKLRPRGRLSSPDGRDLRQPRRAARGGHPDRTGRAGGLRAAALVGIGAGYRARRALPALLVGGAAAGGGDRGGRRRRDRHGARRVLPSAPRRGRRRGAAQGGAAGAGGDRARLAAVHRRGAVRDPRHRPQPGHVAAPVRGRPAGRRGQRALDRRRLSARAARDRRRAGDARAEHGRGLRGADDRDRGRRLPRGAAAAARARRLAPIWRARPAPGSPTWSPPTWSRARSRRRSRRCS